MHGCVGMGARVPKERRVGRVPVTLGGRRAGGRNSLCRKPFSPWHMRCRLLSSPAVPTRAMRACEGRLTRRRSWQQSARKDRPAGAQAGHPGARVKAPAVPAQAEARAVRAARVVPDRGAQADRVAVGAPAVLAALAEAAVRLAAGARRAGGRLAAVDWEMIRVLASGRLIRADVALQALAATIADPALSL